MARYGCYISTNFQRKREFRHPSSIKKFSSIYAYISLFTFASTSVFSFFFSHYKKQNKQNNCYKNWLDFLGVLGKLRDETQLSRVLSVKVPIDDELYVADEKGKEFLRDANGGKWNLSIISWEENRSFAAWARVAGVLCMRCGYAFWYTLVMIRFWYFPLKISSLEMHLKR